MATKRNKAQEIEQPVLSGQQEIALGKLLEGTTQKEAAEAAGVRPEQVSRWLHGDPLFVAILNQRRQQLWHGNRDDLLSLSKEARQVLREAMQDSEMGVRLKAALAVLDRLPKEAPAGEVEAREVQRVWARSESKQRLDDAIHGVHIP